MTQLATQGSTAATGHPCTPVTTIAVVPTATVFSQGALASVVGSATAPHTILVGDKCVPHTMLTLGASTVFVEGKVANKVGDSVDAGAITSGSPTVFLLG